MWACEDRGITVYFLCERVSSWDDSLFSLWSRESSGTTVYFLCVCVNSWDNSSFSLWAREARSWDNSLFSLWTREARGTTVYSLCGLLGLKLVGHIVCLRDSCLFRDTLSPQIRGPISWDDSSGSTIGYEC